MKTGIFMNMSSHVLLKMRNVSDKSCTENQNSVLCSIMFFFFENRTVCEIMWKNTVLPDRPQVTIWRKREAF